MQQQQFNDMFKNVSQNYVWEITSGIPQLDSFLGNGLLKGVISQLYGQSGTGKTQLAMQFMIGASLRDASSYYISTDKMMHLQRFRGLRQNFEKKYDIHIECNWEIDHCTNARPFEDAYRNFIKKVQNQRRNQQQDTQLLIIDNIARVIIDKVSLQTQINLKSDNYLKAKIQKQFVNNLRSEAKKHKFAVLFINNAASSFTQNSNYYKQKSINAALGRSWDTQLDQSIFVTKYESGKRRLKINYSPKARCDEIYFRIQKDGGFIF